MVSEPNQTDRIIAHWKNHPRVAVVIVGGIVLLALSGLIDATERVYSVIHKGYTALRHEPSPQAILQERARHVVAEYLSLSVEQVVIEDFQWMDLMGKGEPLDLYAQYTIGSDYYTGVYSVRARTPQLLYQGTIGQDTRVVEIEGRPHLVVWSNSGSGGWLDLAIYSWDGAGPLHKRYSLGSEDGDPSIVSGQPWFVDGRIYIDGGGSKYIVAQAGNGFELRPYTADVRYPDYGESCHVLRIRRTGSKLALTFDEERLVTEDAGPEQYVVTPALRLGSKESILIDDNMSEPSALRLLVTAGDFEWKAGLYSLLSPRTIGETRISINDAYGDWYSVPIIITRERP